VSGRLVIGDTVIPGRIEIADGRIEAVTQDASLDGPILAPGFVDLHVHGWGGHDAMGGHAELDGMARALLAHGVTAFLPTAVTSPLDRLTAFAEQVRAWIPHAPSDGATPLGFNIEGPAISREKKGAQNAAYIQDPATIDDAALTGIGDGLRYMTVAPEREGAVDLIQRLAARGAIPSLGHSNATVEQAIAGYDAGARTTTHLFNAMSGVDNHSPGLAVAALGRDDAYVELIADGLHVDASLWPVILRTKPPDRLLLVSDAIQLAGAGEGRFQIGDLEVEVRHGSCRLVSDGRLAGSVIALDSAVRDIARSGVPLPRAVQAASTNPCDLLGRDDRGRIAAGCVADLVELDDDLRVRRVMKDGQWVVQ
jgi:N-acetylglucosamine-6-phosphate deacetylase